MRFIYLIPLPLVGLGAAIAVPVNSSLEGASSPQQPAQDLKSAIAYVNGTAFDDQWDTTKLSKRFHIPGFTGTPKEAKKVQQLRSDGAKMTMWMLAQDDDGAGNPVPARPAARIIDKARAVAAKWTNTILPVNQGLPTIQFMAGLTTVEGLEDDLEPVPTKKGRLHSKGGCKTCVKRKKKCNEVHHTCNQCGSLGLACIWKGDTPLSVAPSEWVHKRTWHNDPVNPTCAEYKGMYSPSQRAVVWTDDGAPWAQFEPNPAQPIFSASGARVQVPNPRDWHDLASVEYLQSVHTIRHVRHDIDGEALKFVKDMPPKWFHINKDFPNEETLHALSTVLDMQAISDFPAWPKRITFPIGSVCYQMLLAAPDIKSVVYFLLNHRSTWDERLVVSSITVWNDAKPLIPNKPAFLVHVSKKTDKLERALQKNTEYELNFGRGYLPYSKTNPQPFSAKSGPYWPYPLRPYTPTWPLVAIPPRPQAQAQGQQQAQPQAQYMPQPPGAYLNAFGQLVDTAPAQGDVGQAVPPQPPTGQAPAPSDDSDCDDMYD